MCIIIINIKIHHIFIIRTWKVLFALTFAFLFVMFLPERIRISEYCVINCSASVDLNAIKSMLDFDLVDVRVVVILL